MSLVYWNIGFIKEYIITDLSRSLEDWNEYQYTCNKILYFVKLELMWFWPLWGHERNIWRSRQDRERQDTRSEWFHQHSFEWKEVTSTRRRTARVQLIGTTTRLLGRVRAGVTSGLLTATQQRRSVERRWSTVYKWRQNSIWWDNLFCSGCVVPVGYISSIL